MSFGNNELQLTRYCQDFTGIRITEILLYLKYEYWANGYNYLVQVTGCHCRRFFSVTISVC
jgi:hypothetical protein